MTRTGFFVAPLLLALALPAAAQQNVVRQAYTFLDRNLTIEVVSEVSGQLRVIRGEAGIVQVAARAPDGLASFGLGGREGDQLQLTELGASSTDYIVVVPTDVRVRVLLPNRRAVDVGSSKSPALYTWKKADREEKEAEPVKKSSGGEQPAALDDGMVVNYSHAVAPRVFSIVNASNLSRLEVRFEGAEFRVATNRAAPLNPQRADIMQFAAAEPELELELTVPADARDFQLALGARKIFEVSAGAARSYCDQVMTQRLQNGSRSYTYLPNADRSICR